MCQFYGEMRYSKYVRYYRRLCFGCLIFQHPPTLAEVDEGSPCVLRLSYTPAPPTLAETEVDDLLL